MIGGGGFGSVDVIYWLIGGSFNLVTFSSLTKKIFCQSESSDLHACYELQDIYLIYL